MIARRARYRVCWQADDGAGSDDQTFDSKAKAQADADYRNERNLRNGDHWGHRYTVREEWT